MPTNLQKQTSRTNGAKSNGPKTQDGKARSSRNAIKHGLNSRVVVLANESQELFDQLHAAYRHEWNPQGQSENDLVHEIAAAQWRLRRIKAMETAALDTEMFIQKPEFDQCFSHHTASMRQADAFIMIALHNAPSFDQLNRYETRYSNIYRSSLDTLMKLQRLRGENPEERKEIELLADSPPPAPEIHAPVQNEPADLWQAILQELLALLMVVRGFLTTPKVTRSKRSPLTRNLDTQLTPEAQETITDPENFLWESDFAPTDARSSKFKNDWAHKPAA